MNPTNEQELRQQITPLVIEAIKDDLFDWHYGDEIGDDTWHFMHSVITAHTNAEIAKVLDRLQHELDGGRTYTSVSMIEDTIQAERAKLKEVV